MGLDIYFYKLNEKRNNRTASQVFDDAYHKKENALEQIKEKILADKFPYQPEKIEEYVKKVKDVAEIVPYEPTFVDGKSINIQLVEWIDEVIENVNGWDDLEEVAYFRKVNLLYAYFGERLDHEMSFVEKEDLVDIIKRAKQINDQALKGDDSWKKLAEELLPCCAGFFFGSTAYDEWYLQDLNDVVEKFTTLLCEWDDKQTYVVYFSW